MFENIEKFYQANHYRLIEDKSEGSLRPGKSFTKDVENCISKFVTYHKNTGNERIDEERLKEIIGDIDTNTKHQNLRVMREFGFLVELPEVDAEGMRFEFTQKFKDFIESSVSPKDFIYEELKSISCIDDFTMYFNLLLCTLREAYLYGQVVLFRDSIDKFKTDVKDPERRQYYRTRIFEVYGYSGRDNKPTDDVYSPNLSYMSRAELENLGLLVMTTQKIDGMNNLVLTRDGYELLSIINKNLGGNVEETAEIIAEQFTPEWFAKKAIAYPGLDDEANILLSTFRDKFSPDILMGLSGKELLNTIFLNNENTENLCRILEFSSKIKDMFGSIKGGSAYKYGLFFSSEWKWVAGTNRNPKELSEEAAIALGTEIRNYLVEGYKAILDFGELTSIDDYRNLYEALRTITNGYVDKAWFMKYYFMMFPDLFASDYSDAAQRTVLAAIGKSWEKYALVRMGQIKLYTDECHISNVMFNKIFWENYTDEVVEPEDEDVAIELCYETRCDSNGFARNRILFGAPGTGKSYTVNKEKDKLLETGGTYERVTFHPDYTYASFVGTYKPVPCKDSDDKDAITYEYVPGPFMRTLVKALKNSQEGTENAKPHLLIIEEINRANVAAVFGDVFQLLDRDDSEVSEYPIQASEDMKKYLAKELKVPESACDEIKIPDNMFIWATMNSADQGVFPMDTAFKRRWDFTYLGINSSEDGIAGKTVILGTGEYRRIVEWNALRKAINKELLKFKVNEDKLMGPYFISKKNLGEGTDIDATKFTRIFKNKVLMYLFDDAAKQKRPSLFAGCEEKNLYSAICDEFDEKGVHIFCEDIYNKFIDVPEEG